MGFEVITLILFVATVSIVLFMFGSLLLRLYGEVAIKKTKARLSFPDKIVLSLGSVGTVCILYGWLIEPYWLQVVHVSLSSPKIKAGQTIRIAHVSDIHSDPLERLEKRMPEAIAKEKPDIIVFTGDAINSPEGLPNFRSCLMRLAKIAPTFVVKGNWDAWYFKDSDRFGGTGATELKDKPSMVHIKDNDIWIGGLPVGTKSSVAAMMSGVPEKDYRVFLFHYPDFIEEMEKNKIDLYCAGHTHGGQVALPIYGALITISSRGKQFESGLHHLRSTYEYTNRGIGMEGGSAPRVRFCARPEVTIFDISGTGTH